MKELSIEEKAKRYDNLLVKLQEAKVDNKVCDERYCCVINDIVPELAESEDERIRKEIKQFIRSRGMSLAQSKVDSWIAWLEKKSEQKSAEWSDEDNEHIKSIISTIECNKAQFPNSPAVLEAYNSDLIWLKSLKDRFTWKPSKEQMEALKSSTYCQDEQISKELFELYQQLKKLKG